jgi:3-oxoacid CoA-transferase subunit A
VTLLYAMKDLNKKRGLASLCIGGGEGIAMVEWSDEQVTLQEERRRRAVRPEGRRGDHERRLRPLRQPREPHRRAPRKGTKGLTIVSNNCGTTELRAGHPAQGKQVKKMIGELRRREQGVRAAVPRRRARGGAQSARDLAERIRAGGAASAASSRPPASGPRSPKGKESRTLDGREVRLREAAARRDFAIVRAWKADKWGNLVFRKTARNFSPMMAMAARTTIVEAEQLVEVGEIDPTRCTPPASTCARSFQGAATRSGSRSGPSASALEQSEN